MRFLDYCTVYTVATLGSPFPQNQGKDKTSHCTVSLGLEFKFFQ